MSFEDEIRERLHSTVLYDGQPVLLCEGESGALVGVYDAQAMRLHVTWMNYRTQVENVLERLGL